MRAGLGAAIMLSLLPFAAALGGDGGGDKGCQLQRIAQLDMLPNEAGSILIPVGLNGQPGALALDTGAFWSVLRQGVVSGLGRHEAAITQVGAGGGELNRFVELPSIEVGPSTFKHADFFVGPDELTDDPRVGGNLGANVLQEYDLEIDPGHRKVSLFLQQHCKEAPVYWAESDAVSIPFDLDKHLITIPVVLDGKPLRALLDTGASTSVLSLKAAKALFGLTPQSEDVRASVKAQTLDGIGVALYRHRFKSLDIGGITFNGPLLNLGVDNLERVNRRSLGDKAPDLILGMHQLRLLHLYIAYGEKTLYASTVQGDFLAERGEGDKTTTAPRPAVDPIDREEARDLVESAQAHAQKQEFDAALRDFGRAIDNFPAESWLYQARAQMQAGRKAYPEAIADLGRAIELAAEKDRAGIYFNRGETYLAAGDVDHAIDDLTHAIALDPKLENANLARAEVYLRKGDGAGAMSDLDRAIQLNPHSSRAYRARCWARATLRQGKAALADCDAAIDADPDDIEALMTRATVSLNTDQYAAAIRDYSAVLKRRPDRAVAQYGRGLARRSSGDAAGGTADMAAALQLDPAVGANFTLRKTVEKTAAAR
ncbi:MAG: aspartyl protease family protein [Nevskiales bacterium]